MPDNVTQVATTAGVGSVTDTSFCWTIHKYHRQSFGHFDHLVLLKQVKQVLQLPAATKVFLGLK